MRAYMTNEYKQNLIGNTFISSDSSEKEYDGLKVVEIIRELTEKDYDRELIDGTDKNKKGECRYLVNTMYEVRLENNEIITVYEDEINPDYRGSWGLEESKILPVITNKERCVRQGDIPEVMKLYEFIQELDKKYHVDSRDEENSFGIIQPAKMLLSELYECNLYYFLFGYSSDINHLPKYEAIPLVGECILVGKHGEVGMLTNPYREAQKKKEIEVDENDKLRLIALRQAAYDALKAAYPKKPDFAELDKDASSAECDDVLEQQGFAPGSREYEFHVKFKVKPEEHKTGRRIPYFEVEYYRCGNNKRPHFATSYKDWQNQFEMPHDSLPYQFYQKWNPFHCVEMTKEEYAEMRDDLEKLKKEYDYI